MLLCFNFQLLCFYFEVQWKNAKSFLRLTEVFFYRDINEVVWIRLIAFVYPEARSCFVDSGEQKQDYSELCQRLLLRWRPFNMSIQWMEINKKTYTQLYGDNLLLFIKSNTVVETSIHFSLHVVYFPKTDCHLLSAALTLFSTPDICTTCVWEALMIPELQIKCSF